MNIFENYLKLILKNINHHYKELGINKIESFNGINLEKPPSDFDCDISSNAVLVLAQQNKCNPIKLGNNIKKLLEKNIKDFKDIKIAGPGFLNISLKNEALISIINNILKKNEKFGSLNDGKNYNIEFVSANPTGPMHVGHCRGAIFGDTLSNLLKFNGNKVTKEYYINDYGGQISNFLKSVYLRIRELKYNEKFPNDKSLYPGDYIIEIADKIQKKRKSEFKSFDDEYEFLSKEALNLSMQMIKSDLNMLGISHDNFISEKSIVQSKTLDKAINLLKKKIMLKKVFWIHQKVKKLKIGKRLKDFYLSQLYLEMILIELYRKMMDHGHILQMIQLIILIKFQEITIN